MPRQSLIDFVQFENQLVAESNLAANQEAFAKLHSENQYLLKVISQLQKENQDLRGDYEARLAAEKSTLMELRENDRIKEKLLLKYQRKLEKLKQRV